jgi:nitrate reductase NapE component
MNHAEYMPERASVQSSASWLHKTTSFIVMLGASALFVVLVIWPLVAVPV